MKKRRKKENENETKKIDARKSVENRSKTRQKIHENEKNQRMQQKNYSKKQKLFFSVRRNAHERINDTEKLKKISNNFHNDKKLYFLMIKVTKFASELTKKREEFSKKSTETTENFIKKIIEKLKQIAKTRVLSQISEKYKIYFNNDNFISFENF